MGKLVPTKRRNEMAENKLIGWDKLMFSPKPDITAYELALVLRAAQMEFTENLVTTMPKEAARHFQISTYNFGESH